MSIGFLTGRRKKAAALYRSAALSVWQVRMLSCSLCLQQEQGQDRAARAFVLNLDKVSFIDHAELALRGFRQVTPLAQLAQDPPRRKHFLVPVNVAFQQEGLVPHPDSIVPHRVDAPKLRLEPTFHFDSSLSLSRIFCCLHHSMVLALCQ